MPTIQRTPVVNVQRGDYIVQEDAEDLTEAEINADWDAEEQDWQHVISARHKADVSQLTLAMYNGDQWVTPWGDGYVWRLIADNGQVANMEPEV